MQSRTSADEDGHGPNSYSAGKPSYFNQSSSAPTAADTKRNQENSSRSKAAQPESGGWLGGFFNKFKPKTQMKLPDDKNPAVRFIVTTLSTLRF